MMKKVFFVSLGCLSLALGVVGIVLPVLPTVPFFLLIGLWGTLMLSPVVVFRYGYPLLICLPVVWAMCCNKTDGKL